MADGAAHAFLRGPRLYLRPLREADVTDAYVSWLNDGDVTRYLESGKFPETIESVRDWVRRIGGSRTDLAFAIVERGSDRHVGNVTLHHVNWVHGTADTGLMIGRKDCWGRGYAREAWSLLLEYAFGRLGLRKVIAGVIEGNDASRGALESLGFRVEGRLRQEYLVEGAPRDGLRLGVLRAEFVPLRSGVPAVDDAVAPEPS